MCPSTAMQKTFNLKQHLTQNYAKGNLKMFCHISFMLRCHNKKEEFPVSTAVLLFQRLNKNHRGIAVIDEGYICEISFFLALWKTPLFRQQKSSNRNCQVLLQISVTFVPQEMASLLICFQLSGWGETGS